jgi:hypothetical protein
MHNSHTWRDVLEQFYVIKLVSDMALHMRSCRGRDRMVDKACQWHGSPYERPSWSWSYGSWINNYLCNQCLSPLKLRVRSPFMARCTQYNYVIKCVSDLRQVVVFSGTPVSSTYKTAWLPRYNWNIVESRVKHHNHKQKE